MSQDLQPRTKDSSGLARATDPFADTLIDPDDEQFDQLPGEPLGRDLLKNRVVSAVMRSRWYPGVFQIPIAAVFGLVGYQLLTGPAKAHDNAGTALTEIDQVSRRLADLIEQISMSASREAESANVVAGNIQHIFAVTEQTGEGTRSTAQQVRELTRMAEELRQSVSRFKIA